MIYYKELAYIIMEAEMSHNPPSAGWRHREAAGGGVLRPRGPVAGRRRLMCHLDQAVRQRGRIPPSFFFFFPFYSGSHWI